MADWENLVAGGFAYMTAPFAVHPRDEQRALVYLREALAANLTWEEVEQQLRAYMRKQRMTKEAAEKNLMLAAQLMKKSLA